MRESSELMSPPMRTQASGEYNGECSSTSGMSPPIAVKVVRMIGRKRVLAGFVDRFVEAAAFAAEEAGVVDEQDGVLTSMPASAMRPTTATNERGVARKRAGRPRRR